MISVTEFELHISSVWSFLVIVLLQCFLSETICILSVVKCNEINAFSRSTFLSLLSLTHLFFYVLYLLSLCQ